MPQMQSTETAASRHADVAAAIDYLVRHYAEQPSLDDVARVTGISPHHRRRDGRRPESLLPAAVGGDGKRAEGLGGKPSGWSLTLGTLFSRQQ